MVQVDTSAGRKAYIAPLLQLSIHISYISMFLNGAHNSPSRQAMRTGINCILDFSLVSMLFVQSRFFANLSFLLRYSPSLSTTSRHLIRTSFMHLSLLQDHLLIQTWPFHEPSGPIALISFPPLWLRRSNRLISLRVR